ncbi:helix-turn-helix domain-containing protein [Afipia sp. TerB]
MATSDDIKRVRQLRKESQEAFGTHFGVDQSTIHRWETIGPPQRGAAAVGIGKVLSDLEAESADSETDAAA